MDIVIFIIIGMVAVLIYFNYHYTIAEPRINTKTKIDEFKSIFETPDIKRKRKCSKHKYTKDLNIFDIEYLRCNNNNTGIISNIKEFHKDFFGFRDKTEHNSSMRKDAVDNMVQLQLYGTTGEALQSHDAKISDIYDCITKN